MVLSTPIYALDDEFGFDSPYWDNIPEELWESLDGQFIIDLSIGSNTNIDMQSTVGEASTSNVQFKKSHHKRPSQLHDGERET